MRTVFSFRVGAHTVRVGNLRLEHAGHRPCCCGYRQISVTEPGEVCEQARCSITDVRKLRRAYRRAYRSISPARKRALRRAHQFNWSES